MDSLLAQALAAARVRSFAARSSRSADAALALSGSSKQCPGDRERGCPVMVPLQRKRCRFCRRTVELQDAARVGGGIP